MTKHRKKYQTNQNETDWQYNSVELASKKAIILFAYDLKEERFRPKLGIRKRRVLLFSPPFSIFIFHLS